MDRLMRPAMTSRHCADAAADAAAHSTHDEAFVWRQSCVANNTNRTRQTTSLIDSQL